MKEGLLAEDPELLLEDAVAPDCWTDTSWEPLTEVLEVPDSDSKYDVVSELDKDAVDNSDVDVECIPEELVSGYGPTRLARGTIETSVFTLHALVLSEAHMTDHSCPIPRRVLRMKGQGTKGREGMT